MFRIVEAFLEAGPDGGELTYERIMREAAPELRTGADPARYGANALAHANAWWMAAPTGCARD